MIDDRRSQRTAGPHVWRNGREVADRVSRPKNGCPAIDAPSRRRRLRMDGENSCAKFLNVVGKSSGDSRKVCARSGVTRRSALPNSSAPNSLIHTCPCNRIGWNRNSRRGLPPRLQRERLILKSNIDGLGNILL